MFVFINYKKFNDKYTFEKYPKGIKDTHPKNLEIFKFIVTLPAEQVKLKSSLILSTVFNNRLANDY